MWKKPAIGDACGPLPRCFQRREDDDVSYKYTQWEHTARIRARCDHRPAVNPSSPWQPWLLHNWCVLPLQCSKPSSLSNQYTVSHTRVRVLLSVWFLVFVCVCACVSVEFKCLLVYQMRALTNHMSTPPQNHDPPLVKELLCHFAPTCTSLSPLRTLGPRAVGESKILGSVSRRSQGHPRTFRDVAETIRKSRASLSVSVIKLGRKLEYVCRLFSPLPVIRASLTSEETHGLLFIEMASKLK